MIVQVSESVERLRESISVHAVKTIEMLIAVKGQIIIAVKAMHIFTNDGILSLANRLYRAT